MLLMPYEEYLKVNLYSHRKIPFSCDYCNKLFFRRKINHTKISNKNDCLIEKDCCKECIKYKNTEALFKSLNCQNTDLMIKHMVNKKIKTLSGVYSIRDKQNNKKYIGSSKDLVQRFKAHLLDMKNKDHHISEFNSLDPKHLEFNIIEYDTALPDLINREYHFINLYNSHDPLHGYNTMHTKRNTVRSTLKPSKKSIEARLNSSKFTLQQIKYIKRALYNGERIKDIALEFNCKESTIHSIKSCSTWENVLPELNEKLRKLTYVGIHKGENNACSKLDETMVKEIKTLIISGLPLVTIAKKFNVSSTTIGHIKRGKLWSHVS
ncbi:GIY-YIG nuclease family protein [Bacillus subtilis]|uniref:GIY-YIG nuclease family protein n=1 Tax=Bacillus subtilis TaxID=1423 RepID=A0AC61YVY0_BACIU|nr:GIY-YIG nuclease family protein [Bacillus subtilis]